MAKGSGVVHSVEGAANGPPGTTPGGTIARVGNPGQSAEEHAKRLIGEAGKWAAGAEGERRVADALTSLPAGWTVVHDRLLRPGRSAANLDHVVIGPTGVYLVDAKNRAGRVTEHDGGLFQHRHREGRSETVSLAGELKKVHGMAAYMAAETDRPVTPVLCLAGSRAEEFGEPRMVRGVWVVPVAGLPAWLRARPVVIPPDVVPTVATRVITDFPSTTTDPALLSAMGGASMARQATRSGRGQRPARQPRVVAPLGRTAAPPRSSGLRRTLGRLVVGGLLAVTGLWLLAQLPAIMTAGVEHLAASGASSPSATASATAATAAPKTATGPTTKSPLRGSASKSVKSKLTTTKVTTRKVTATKVPVTPLGPPDCANASAAEIKAIIHRSVKPVVTSRGCVWGTRLDDGSTALVNITVSPGHDTWDSAMTTSVKQKRVVFGSSYSGVPGIGTMASVAAGQPITRGVRARADIVVVVATRQLGVSDDQARQMAVAIAAAANG